MVLVSEGFRNGLAVRAVQREGAAGHFDSGPHHVAEGRHQPRTHADHQGVGRRSPAGSFWSAICWLAKSWPMQGQSLAKELARPQPIWPTPPPSASQPRRRSRRQSSRRAPVAEVVHHRPLRPPAKALGDPQVIAVERAQVDDAEPVEAGELLHALGLGDRVGRRSARSSTGSCSRSPPAATCGRPSPPFPAPA